MSSSQARLQPQPPASPSHSESRRSSAKAGRLVKCSSKSKTASTNSVCKRADGPDTTTTSRAAMVLRGEQKPEEPWSTGTAAQPSGNRRAVKEEAAHSGGNADHTHCLSADGPEEQPEHKDLSLGGCQEQVPGATCEGASQANKAEVRPAASLNHCSSLDWT